MKKYDLSLDGIPMSVYPMEHKPTELKTIANGLIGDGLAVALYPEDNADFGVTCIDKSNIELREPYLPLAALSCFFKSARSLPDISFEVLYRGRIYELPVQDKPRDFSVNVGKCKFMCSKTAKYPDGVEIAADVIDGGIACVTTVCRDSDLFGVERLSALSSILGMKTDTPAIAISFDGVVRLKYSGTLPFYDAVSLAVFSLVRRGRDIPPGKLTATVNGRDHTFRHLAGRLTFTLDVKYLS